MYLRILKKDLKRKKTMNVIMLIFIVMAAMFVSSSANNMITVATALDDYFDLAEVPDYFIATAYEEEAERFADFAESSGYGLKTSELVQIDPQYVTVNGEKLEYSNSLSLSALKGTKIFDENDSELTDIADGEIYITNVLYNYGKDNFYDGCKIVIECYGVKKEFTLKGIIKDAVLGSSMVGMTRLFISENDMKSFYSEDMTRFFVLSVYTDDEKYTEKFNALDLKVIMNADRAETKMMYIMDTLTAAIVLTVSVCLILISMVMLRFTINFTISEEYREIGVMKAIGIGSGKIRGLYIVKYSAIALVGAAAGLALSFPFGAMLTDSVSKNIIISGKSRFYLNIVFAAAAAAVVVLFCYFCTRKIKKISPIDAIRSGETGERYSRKSVIRLSGTPLAPVPFMAVNDILSGLKKYVSMILIFTLGLLLIIIPINTINTLQSDKLIKLFNMADCDLVISTEMLFSSNGENEEMIEEKLENVRKTLADNNTDADVFQEIMFMFTVSKGDNKTSSLAFLGVGGVTADMYSYIEGTPPQNKNEVVLSYITADKIGAAIGDEVEIIIGGEARKYTVTAINQSMNNMGEGIRFYQGDNIDLDLAAGSFGIQILYRDNPDSKAVEERKKLLQNAYPDNGVYSAGEYINYMIGDVASQLEDVKSFILLIVVCINILVAVLMVKSFITKEKGEIAVLKAIGFKNSSLMAWQVMRIGIVLVISIVLGTVLSTPLSHLTSEPIFKMMGAYSIEFEVVPLEVYLVYPLVVLVGTVAAAAVGALQVWGIGASETGDSQ